MQALQEQITYLSRKFKVSPERFNLIIYNSGERYVEQKYSNEVVRSRLLQSSVFWGWWKSIWSNYMRQYIVSTQGISKVDIGEFERCFYDFVYEHIYIHKKMFNKIVKPSKIKEL